MIWSLEPSGGHQPCQQSKRSFDQFFMAKFHEIAPNYRLRNVFLVCVFFSSISRQHKFQPADEWIEIVHDEKGMSKILRYTQFILATLFQQ